MTIDCDMNLIPNVIELGDVKQARVLVTLLSDRRANADDEWLNVGLCLHHIDPCLLDSWVSFSCSRRIGYQAGQCEQRWKTIKYRDSGCGFSTLCHWAEYDSSGEYHDYRRSVAAVAGMLVGSDCRHPLPESAQ